MKTCWNIQSFVVAADIYRRNARLASSCIQCSLGSYRPSEALRVAFYVPSPTLVRSVPASTADYWPWIIDAVRAAPAQLGDGRGVCPWLGPYNWTIQTCLELKSSGFACELTATLPDEGVVIAHGDFLPPALAPSARRLIVEIKPDRPLQCQFANMVVVQNSSDPIRQWPLRMLVQSVAVPYWPQPGLIPRDASRGDRFENVGFMGRSQNFLEEAASLASGLAARGLNWMVMPMERWHDYRDLDAVVAVRPPVHGLPSDAVPFQAANRKPASKLVNAWLAGVPAVLSPDDAFRQVRTSSLDYLEAESVADVLTRVDQLRHDAVLRREMIANGLERGAEFSRIHVTRRWLEVLQSQVLPAYLEWTSSPARRAAFYASRRSAHAVLWRVQHWKASRRQAT